jgi:hypothetical protein
MPNFKCSLINCNEIFSLTGDHLFRIGQKGFLLCDYHYNLMEQFGIKFFCHTGPQCTICKDQAPTEGYWIHQITNQPTEVYLCGNCNDKLEAFYNKYLSNIITDPNCTRWRNAEFPIKYLGIDQVVPFNPSQNPFAEVIPRNVEHRNIEYVYGSDYITWGRPIGYRTNK